MSWIALLLSVSDFTGATTPSSPSNTASRGDDTVALSSAPPPSPPAPHWSPWAPPRPGSPLEPPPAEPAPGDEFAAHPVTIESRLGVAIPTGAFGGALSYSPVPAIGLDVGAGTNGKGLQLACALRARLVLDSRTGGSSSALTLTSGLSTGAYVDEHLFEKLTSVDGPGPSTRSYQRAYWWNTDIGVEKRYETAVLRFFAGAALLLNSGAGTDIVTERGAPIERPTTSLAYVGIGLGLAP